MDIKTSKLVGIQVGSCKSSFCLKYQTLPLVGWSDDADSKSIVQSEWSIPNLRQKSQDPITIILKVSCEK